LFVLIPSLAIVVVYAAYAGVYRHTAWWVNIVLTLTLLGVHMLELQFLSPGNLFRFLDEAFFARESQAPLSELLSHGVVRYNAYLVYAHVAQIMTPEWILKVVNIPWLWVLLIQFYRWADSSPWVLRLFPFALPYLYILSFLNMRDMLTLVTVMMLFGLFRTRLRYLEHVAVRSLAIILALLLLATLRPQWVIIVAASILILPLVTGGTRARVAGAVATVAIVAVSLPFLQPWVTRLQVTAAYSVEARGSERVALITSGQGFGAVSAAIGVGRQLFTPLPTSKLREFMRGPPGQNLYVKEVSRMVMNIWFMGSVVFVLMRLGQFFRYVRRRKHIALLAVFAGINTLVYGMYFFGVGSSRNKVLPMILVFLFVCHSLDQRRSAQRPVGQDAPTRRLEPAV
jgi:hypothetical protein